MSPADRVKAELRIMAELADQADADQLLDYLDYCRSSRREIPEPMRRAFVRLVAVRLALVTADPLFLEGECPSGRRHQEPRP